jgi:glycopeptide antibiotics resistance protein
VTLDIDDFILNSDGAALVYFIFKKYTKLAKKEEKKKGWLKKDHKNHAEINYAVNLYKEDIGI